MADRHGHDREEHERARPLRPASGLERAAGDRRGRGAAPTPVFADLERAGLITNARSTEGRCASVLALTPARRAALAADMADRDAWMREGPRRPL